MPPTPPERWVFNERFECKTCKIAYQDPEPSLFSFNNPYGACPRCQGFGNTVDFDLDLVIPDKNKSLAEGAVEPWTKPRYRVPQNEMRRAARAKRFPRTFPITSSPLTSADGWWRATMISRASAGSLPIPGEKEVQTPRSRVPEPVSWVYSVPGMPAVDACAAKR